MKVVCIGAGNVATHLTTALYDLKFEILQVYSHTYQNAKILAQQVEAVPVADLSQIVADADVYIFAVKDSILEHVLKHLPKTKGIWVHTAGSIPMRIFEKYTPNYGVLYPFQTFSKNRKVDWKSIPIFIEASNSSTMCMVRNIARELSDQIAELSSEKRKQVHLSGVFACNFVNHMYALSECILKKADLPFDIVLPLINETCAKVHTLSPKNAQTGPAIRFDKNVMNQHLEMIDDESIKEIYKTLSENIHNTNK